MKLVQIVFNSVALFTACVVLFSALSLTFLVLPGIPVEKRAFYYFLIIWEILVGIPVVGGALVNFGKGKLLSFPTGVIIAGCFISLWLLPIAIWGIVLLVLEQKKQRTVNTAPTTSPTINR